jgi:hypothetical protein
MNRIVSFGDSFIFGTDLSDIVNYRNDGLKFSKLTWPALLANDLNLKYHSYAYGGSGNAGICRRVLFAIESGLVSNNDFLVIQWTWKVRYDIFTNKENAFRNDHINPDIGWETLHVTDDNYNSNTYYKNIQSDENDKYESLKQIVLVSTILDQYKIPYFMTCLDSTLTDEINFNPPYVNILIKQIKDKLHWFNNKGFYHWAKDQNFTLGESGHPVDDAHYAAFKYIKHEITM